MTIKNVSVFLVTMFLFATSSWALQSNQKRLLQNKTNKQCFYMESVRKSDKYGWLNEKKAKQISKYKRKKAVTASSPVHVRKVVVPKSWCQNS